MGAFGIGFPRALARSCRLFSSSASLESGGGEVDVTEAEKMPSAESEESHSEMCWLRSLEKVLREVTVEDPFGSRMRRSGAEVGSAVVDCWLSRDGGVHEDNV